MLEKVVCWLSEMLLGLVGDETGFEVGGGVVNSGLTSTGVCLAYVP